MKRLGITLLISFLICTIIYLSINVDSDFIHSLSSIFQVPSYFILLLIGKNVHSISFLELLISTFVIYTVIIMLVVYFKTLLFNGNEKQK